MSVIIRDACISDAPRLLEIYDYYVQHTAISFEYTTPTQEEFCRRMRHIMSRYPIWWRRWTARCRATPTPGLLWVGPLMTGAVS